MTILNELIDKTSENVLYTTLTIVALFLFGLFFPIAALPIKIITPLPVLLCRIKLGRINTFLSITASTLILLLIFNDLGKLIFLFLHTILLFFGLVIGELLAKKIKLEIVFLTSSIFFATCLVIALCFFPKKTSPDIASYIYKYINLSFDIGLENYNNSSLSNEIMLSLQQKKFLISKFILITLPSYLAIISIFIAWINILIIKAVIYKNVTILIDFKKLNHWRSPKNSVWVFISFLFMAIAPIELIKYVGINGIFFFSMVYFFQGISIISFYLQKKSFSTILKILVYMLISLNQLLFMATIIVGLIDVWIDIRKKIKPKKINKYLL